MEFREFALYHGFEVAPAHPQRVDDVVVHHDRAPGGDRAHRQLLMARHPELAHYEHIERRAQGTGDLRRHRHSAAWQREDDDVLAAQPLERLRERAPRFVTVLEHVGLIHRSNRS